MRPVLVGAMFGVLLLPLTSAAQDVKTQSDKDYDFKKIKTFAVKLGTSWGNPISEKQVLAEVSEALTAKGLTVAPEESADAVVAVHGATETKKSLTTFYSGWGGSWHYGGMGGMGTSGTTVHEYQVGTLVVDVFDAKTKELTFRAEALDELSNKAEKNKKKLDKATKKMFKDLPVGEQPAKK